MVLGLGIPWACPCLSGSHFPHRHLLSRSRHIFPRYFPLEAYDPVSSLGRGAYRTGWGRYTQGDVQDGDRTAGQLRPSPQEGFWEEDHVDRYPESDPWVQVPILRVPACQLEVSGDLPVGRFL